MSVLNNKIRAWWIQKSEISNIANKAEFCDFKPTVYDKGWEWVRVISLDDFHREVGMNITRWVEVCNELVSLKKELQETKAQLEKAVDVIQDMYDAEGFDTVLVEQFLSRIKNKQGSEK